jgi:hypothetical protein
MPHCVFAPNKNLTGGASFAKLRFDNTINLSVFKQIANNANKKDNFDFQDAINVKLGAEEIGALLRAIRNNSNFGFYHSFQNDGKEMVTKGSFRYFIIEAKEDKPAREGYGLTVIRGEKEVKVSYSLGSAETLAAFLQTCLERISEEIIRDDDLKDEEYRKQKEQKTAAAPVTEKKPAATAKTANKKAKETPPAPEAPSGPEENAEDIDF